MRAKGAGNPFHRAALFHQCPFGIQVIHVFRPVLDGGIPQLGILFYKQLHAAGMEIGYVVFRCRAAFNEVQVRTLVHNNQGMLKLTGTLCIQAEIGLQGNGHLDTFRHIHKGTAGPNRTVQRRKLMVCGRYQGHEILPDHVGIFPFQGAFHIRINHALLRHLVFHIVVHQLGIILCSHACQRRPFCLGNSQALKGILNVFRHTLPIVLHFGIRAHIGGNMVHIQAFDRRTPIGKWRFVVNIQRLQPELMHPLRVMLFFGNFINNCRGQTLFDSIGVLFFVPNVIDAAVDVRYLTFFFHLHRSFLRFQPSAEFTESSSKPFALISSTSDASPFFTMTPFSITWV